ncbi:acyltransferase [Streptomyces sp. NBC_01808]|uniref:acyltransferase n=1 Tax=Streptomyces sp. NBC_01808 TaxID=2975947 RepID=UPI002DD92425|nr:acyltransferase [Streptomyces sp. NBC_01808]WSA35905.1 acyltransferase [Streptomyces sp. NBC_01808]WSA42296.1 acyltransferase [Streptomyces sp. NBC_01808]
MALSTEEALRLTVAALMSRTRETQTALAAAIGMDQRALSRRQTGASHWLLDDVDRLAAHWGMTSLDLLAGPTHAATKLPAPPSTGSRTSAPAPAEPPVRPSAGSEPAPAATPRRATSSSASSFAQPAGSLGDMIRDRVAAELSQHQGDMQAAQAALIHKAIPDVMKLFKASRIGGRYEHSEFPPTETDVLAKRSQKDPDLIWEGRPKWRAVELHREARAGHITLDVTALDANAAYLAAFTCWLPIGRLVASEPSYQSKRAGIYRITPPEWDNPDLPNPLGDRKTQGDLWITTPTLKLLLDCAKNGLCAAPEIHEAYTSGATESLLRSLKEALRDARQEAIDNDDIVTLEYVKSMYSKFVSTIGESTNNRELRRPDWMHTIRSQAFANLWRKAYKAHQAGLTVVQMAGTDELHVSGGDWRQVFTEGRKLTDMKEKETYTLGGD